ncbi:GNAT family N-acetyltransferase [Streptomyces sp. NPDC050560]|uniref:GNAT family N-acetyltransferase n=1 Tax=Streptomyces sp. NPDC050560 TaxID=3365630 RepID=UPI0037902C24
MTADRAPSGAHPKPSGVSGAAGGWRLIADVHEFLAGAGEFLRSDPATHTLLLTVTDVVLRSGPDAFGGAPAHFGVLSEGGAVVGAFARTPPFGVLLSALPAGGAARLAAVLAETHPDAAGCTGDADTAVAFARAWHRRTGTPTRVEARERLYRLGALTPPKPAPPGRARTATEADRDLLGRWYTEFGEAVGRGAGRPALDWADDRIAYGGVLLWELDDGTPVAMAGASRLIAGQVRVAPVYTPKPLRGRGYAGAATAELSARLAASPAEEVLLFADLSNPTSNALYQRLGYRSVRDFTVVAFGADDG